jgi:hypothetical protein
MLRNTLAGALLLAAASPAFAAWFATTRSAPDGQEQVIGTLDDKNAVYLFCHGPNVLVAYVRTGLPDVFKEKMETPEGLVQVDGLPERKSPAVESFEDGNLTARFPLPEGALKDLSNAVQKVRIALLSQGKVLHEAEFTATFAADRAKEFARKCDLTKNL